MDPEEDRETAADREEVRKEQERIDKLVADNSERWKARNSARNRIYEEVRTMRLSPEEGDAEAMREGTGPLQRRPDPVNFQPLEVAQWPALWALGWAVWKSPDQVRDYCWSEYRAGCWDWIIQTVSARCDCGFTQFKRKELVLQAADAPSLRLLEIVTELSWTDLQAPLLRELRELRELRRDSIRASGIDASGRRVQLGVLEWSDLILRDGLEGRLDAVSDRGVVMFENIKVPLTGLLQLWPPSAGDAEPVHHVRGDRPGGLSAETWLMQSQLFGRAVCLPRRPSDRSTLSVRWLLG
jgi:hypothetical protein